MLGVALGVVGVEARDLEATGLDDRGHVAVEVAATRQTLLQTVHPVLPSPHLRIWRRTMLDEMECASRSQDASELLYGEHRVRDAAQRPGAQRGVSARVLERDPLPVEANELDRHR